MKYPVTDASAKLYNGKFTDGDPALGVEPSVDKAAWMNMVFDELIAVAVGGGQVPSETTFNQVLAAINNLIAIAIATRAPASHGHLWSQLSGIPSTFAPSPHTQDWNTLTGVPIAITQPQSDNSTRISTTAFVKTAIAALVNSSPGALDTLNELAIALGNDPNFATTITNALAGKANTAGNYPGLTVGAATNAGNSGALGGYSVTDIFNACLPNLQGSNSSQRGYMVAISTGGAVVLPAGGTWFHSVIGFWPDGNGREGMIGFSAGGTALNIGGNGLNYGFAIKVA